MLPPWQQSQGQPEPVPTPPEQDIWLPWDHHQKISAAATAAASGSPAALCLATCAVSAASVLPVLPAGTPQQPLCLHVPAAPVQPAAARCPSQQQQRQTCM
jgi:hypothetical protein